MFQNDFAAKRTDNNCLAIATSQWYNHFCSKLHVTSIVLICLEARLVGWSKEISVSRKWWICFCFFTAIHNISASYSSLAIMIVAEIKLLFCESARLVNRIRPHWKFCGMKNYRQVPKTLTNDKFDWQILENSTLFEFKNIFCMCQ